MLINHCWCSDSIWGGNYNCRVIVSLHQYETREDIFKRKNTSDWDNILIELNSNTIEETRRLKPEVIQWLNTNVKGRDWDEHKQGWAVGTDEYNRRASTCFSIFFERITDARKFIKHWSIHKYPEHYLNYFKDIRREYNPTTKRMQQVPR